MCCGKYIVIEGLEGAGKTTASNTLVKILHEFGIKEVFVTHEPGGTLLGEKLHSILLNNRSLDNEIINSKAETLMFYAARIQLVELVIKPTLARGCWVIGDRHDLSTQAYQGGGRGIDYKILNILRKIILGNFRPNLTLYLDVTPEISFKRISNRYILNRIEKESLEFFENTRVRYLELASQDDTTYTIDTTNRSLEEVNNMIYKIISNSLKKKLI